MFGHWSTTEIIVPFFFELVNLAIRVDNLESEKKIKFEKKRKEYGMKMFFLNWWMMNLNLFKILRI